MSYDLEIWSLRPIEPATIEGRGWQIVVEAPAPAEPEDLPEAVRSARPGAKFLCRIELEGKATEAAFKKLAALAAGLADEADGVLIDRQLDQPATPPPVSDERTVIEMSWWWTGDADRSRAWAARLIEILQQRLPEALPHRYGQFEPLRNKLAATGIEGFLDFWENEKLLILWKPKDPVRSVSTPSRLHRGPTRQGYFFPSLRLSIDRRELDREASRGRLMELWDVLCEFIDPFYGDVRTHVDPKRSMTFAELQQNRSRTHPISGPCFRGLPPGPVHAWIVGEPYRSLLKDHVSGIGSGGRIRSTTDDWRQPHFDPRFPPELVQPPLADYEQGGLMQVRSFPESEDDYAKVWPFSPPFAA